MREMSEDEFAEALPGVLDGEEPVAVMRGGDRIATMTPAVPEPRANGAKINEIIERSGVPADLVGDDDGFVRAVREARTMGEGLDTDPWRD